MKIKLSKLAVVFVVIFSILKISFPFSSYIRILVIGLYGIYMLITKMGKINKNQKIYGLFFWGFIIWCVLSYFWADYKIGVSEQLFNMLCAIMVNIGISYYISSNKLQFENIVVWVMPILLIFLIQSLLVGDYEYSGRFSASSSVNQFGIVASFVYLLALYAYKTNSYRRLILGIIILLSGGITLFTGSRKALVNLIFFSCSVILFEKCSKNILKIIGKIVGVIVLGGVIVFAVLNIEALYDVLGYRIISLKEYFNGNVNEDLSALRRSYMKDDAIELFYMHPITGIGLNNYKYTARYGTYAHSNIYEILANLGIVGFLLYYVPILLVFIKALIQWKNNVKYSIIPLSILTSFIICEFSNVSYMYRNIHMFIGLASGIVFTNDNGKCKKDVQKGLL